MALPGTKHPNDKPMKKGMYSKLPLVDGAKPIKTLTTRFDEVADINKAPTSRVYTKDYLKSGRDKDDTDTVTAALGNPFRI